jgi:anti-sigma factor RsiW
MTMDCRQIEELLMDYLYEELDTAQTDAYRAHLRGCQKCEALLAGYQRTRQAMRMLPDMEPPSSVTERLLAEAAAAVKARAAAPAAVGAAATVGGVPGVRPVEKKESEGGFFGWLAGVFRPVALHPAFAAVAGMVLVAGVAGALYMRGTVTEKSTTARAPSLASEEAASGAPAPTAQAGVPPATSADRLPAAANDPTLHLGGTPSGGDQLAFEARPTEPADTTTKGSGVVTVTPESPRARLGEEQSGAVGYGSGGGGRSADKNLADGRGAGGGKAARDDGAFAGAIGGEAESRGYVDGDDGESRPTAKPTAPAGPTAAPPAPPPPSKDAPAQTQKAQKTPEAEKKPATEPKRAPAKQGGGGSAGGDSGGVAAGAPAPREESMAADEDAEMANEPAPRAQGAAPGESKKKKEAESSPEKEARKLHGQARAKANMGDCKGAISLRDRIYRVDPTYYSNKVKNDPDLARCNKADKSRKKPGDSDALQEKAPDSAPATNK